MPLATRASRLTLGIFGLAGLATASTSLASSSTSIHSTSPTVVSVVAENLRQLAEKLYLDYDCIANPTEEGMTFEPGYWRVISMECCDSSCQGPLCKQRVECKGETASVQPTGPPPEGVIVMIVSEGAATEASASQSSVQPISTLVTQIGGSKTLTLSLSTPLSQEATITTSGTVLTINPKPTTAASTILTTSASSQQVQTVQTASNLGESLANPTETITDPPAGSSASSSTAVLPRESPGPGIAIALDQESYVLPQTGSVDLLQPDGSTMTLFPDSIILGSQTASFDAGSHQTGIAFGEMRIDSGPVPESSPPSNGASGFDGLINALDSLAGSASSIVDNLNKINDLGTRWASGDLSNSDFSSSVGSLFDDAAEALSNFESTTRSTLQNFAPQSHELTEDGWRQVSDAYTASQRQLDITSSMRRLTRAIANIRNRTITKIKTYWTVGTVVAVAAADDLKDLVLFADHDWKREKQQPPQTTSSNSTEAVRPTTRRTSSRSSASTTATAVPYYLTSKSGTDPSVFDEYLKSMSIDSSEGPMDRYSEIPWQSQVVNLTVEQAKDAESQQFMLGVELVTEPPEEDDSSSSTDSAIRRTLPRAPSDLVRRQNSDTHLRLLSTKNQQALARTYEGEPDYAGELPDYLYDPVLGQGQTIYVIDDGFNMAHTDLAPGPANRRVESHYLSNSITLPGVAEDDRAAEDINTHTGHGTHVASIAAGLTHGVASRANLVLIKQKNAAKNPYTGNMKNRKATKIAVDHAWYWLLQDVEEKRRNGNTGRFIVNFSGGFEFKGDRGQPPPPLMNEILNRALELCWQRDIITVVAAGDEGDSPTGSLDKFTPQNIGRQDNALITVGGVHADGKVWRHTTYQNGNVGSMTVYALAYQVNGAGHASNTASDRLDGTSQAAPAVAGLAAYLASLTSFNRFLEPGQVAKTMKDYIVQFAYQRNDEPFPAAPHELTKEPPKDSVIVAYNRAPDGLCSMDSPVRRSVDDRSELLSMARRQDSSDVDVVVDGNVVDEIWSQSYCTATASSSAETVSTTSSSSTAPSESTTASESTIATESTTASATDSNLVPAPTFDGPTIFSEPPAPPAPTVNIAQGILTCGTKTHEDEDAKFFSLDEMSAARDAFCGNMTNHEPRVIFEPGENRFVDHVYTVPSNTARKIRVSANWVAAADSECKTFRFASKVGLIDAGDSGQDICEHRVDVPIHNCDKVKGSNEFWKQGGKFFRNCITWEITAADS